MDVQRVLEAADELRRCEARVEALHRELVSAKQERDRAHFLLHAAIKEAAAGSSGSEDSVEQERQDTSGTKRRGRSRRVLTCLREAPERDWSAEEVAEALGEPEAIDSIRTALGRLVNDGEAVRTTRGRFQSVSGVHAELEYDEDDDSSSAEALV